MNKRADTMLEVWLVNLIFIMLILVTMFVGIYKISDNTLHTERAKSRDFAFTYDVSSLAAGNLNMAYDIPEEFSISLSESCRVEISEKKKNLPSVYICNSYMKSTNLILSNKAYSIRKNV